MYAEYDSEVILHYKSEELALAFSIQGKGLVQRGGVTPGFEPLETPRGRMQVRPTAPGIQVQSRCYPGAPQTHLSGSNVAHRFRYTLFHTFNGSGVTG